MDEISFIARFKFVNYNKRYISFGREYTTKDVYPSWTTNSRIDNESQFVKELMVPTNA